MTVSSLIEYLRPIICTSPVAAHIHSSLSLEPVSTQPHEFSSGKLKIDKLIVLHYKNFERPNNIIILSENLAKNGLQTLIFLYSVWD